MSLLAGVAQQAAAGNLRDAGSAACAHFGATRIPIQVSRQRQTHIVARSSSHSIAVLAGDGIGPEISAVAVQLLREAGQPEGVDFHFREALIGGAATDATGTPLPDSTFDACKESDAVLLAAIGGCVGAHESSSKHFQAYRLAFTASEAATWGSEESPF